MSTKPEQERGAVEARLRRHQAHRVMPLIGGLLDARDGLPNDVACNPELAELLKHIEGVRVAMEERVAQQKGLGTR